jgi:hypothetical protein
MAPGNTDPKSKRKWNRLTDDLWFDITPCEEVEVVYVSGIRDDDPPTKKVVIVGPPAMVEELMRLVRVGAGK